MDDSIQLLYSIIWGAISFYLIIKPKKIILRELRNRQCKWSSYRYYQRYLFRSFYLKEVEFKTEKDKDDILNIRDKWVYSFYVFMILSVFVIPRYF